MLTCTVPNDIDSHSFDYIDCVASAGELLYIRAPDTRSQIIAPRRAEAPPPRQPSGRRSSFALAGAPRGSLLAQAAQYDSRLGTGG